MWCFLSLFLPWSVGAARAVEPTHVVLGRDIGTVGLGQDLSASPLRVGTGSATLTVLGDNAPACVLAFDSATTSVRLNDRPSSAGVTQVVSLGMWAFTEGASEVAFAYGGGAGVPLCLAPNCVEVWGTSRVQALLDRVAPDGATIDAWIGAPVVYGAYKHAVPWVTATPPYPDGGGRAGWVGIQEIGGGDAGSVVEAAHCVSGDAGLGRWAGFTPGLAGGTGEFVVAAADRAANQTRLYRFIEAVDMPVETAPCTALTEAGASEAVIDGVTAVQLAYSASTRDRGHWWALLDPVRGISAAYPNEVTRDAYVVTDVAGPEMLPVDLVRRARPVVVLADLLGDASPDLVVADPLSAAGGTVRVWTAGVDRSGAVRFSASPDVVLEGLEADARFGESLAVTPDVDADGRPELAVGAPGADGGRGAVEIYLSGSFARVDTDLDGVTDDLDCFPEDASRYPGLTVYRDADGDGHGDPAAPLVVACPDNTAGHVLLADDCDDTASDVKPGGIETCNGRDDDCDGTADVGLLLTFHVDADGDGQGDPAAPVEACEEAAGLASNADDCDDSRADVGLGAPEVLGDDVDQDCNGHDRTVAWGGGCASVPGGRRGTSVVGALVALLVVVRVSRRRAGAGART